MSEDSGCFASIAGLFIGAICFAGWITHLVVCFQQDKWGFLIAGALFFPVAIIHGFGKWFHWW